MHLELLVPGLLAALRTPRSASLELLLARGRATRSDARSPEAWLQEAFDLASLPAGALSARQPGATTWVRADPVHLRLLRDRVLVVPAQAFRLAEEEAQGFCAALNRHFGERLQIEMRSASQWCARVPQSLQVEDRPAIELAGQAAQPARGDALLTEIQMVLHEHPLNEAREARGEPAINSLWLWGGGAAPREAAARWRSVTSDDPLALGLARSASLRGEAPATAAAWLARMPEEGRHLVVLDALRGPARLGDEEGFVARLAALEQEWFAPALAALRSARIGMLTVHVPDAAPALAVETIRADLRRFWRRPRPLAAWIG